MTRRRRLLYSDRFHGQSALPKLRHAAGDPWRVRTNADGIEHHEYCMFCFQNGAFTAPEMTVDQMVESSIQFMTRNMKFPKDQAEQMSKAVIPGLKRWKK